MATLSESGAQLHVESPGSDTGRDYAERALQNYLVGNPKKLGIPDSEIIASEYQTSVGRIDLLVASGQNTLWVVELKAGIAGRDAIGQIVSYLAAVRDVHPDKAVLGLLVATEFDKACVAAHRAIGDVQLKKVRIEYSLVDAAPMNLHKGHIPALAPPDPLLPPGKARIVTEKTKSGGSVVACWSCGTNREVSLGAQGYSCSVCKAFNTI